MNPTYKNGKVLKSMVDFTKIQGHFYFSKIGASPGILYLCAKVWEFLTSGGASFLKMSKLQTPPLEPILKGE